MSPMLDSRTRFAASAEHYQQHRPSYPDALVDWVIDTTGQRPPARVVDVGCGTGIATRLFAARGYHMVGVDPNREMLAFAQAKGGARYLCAEAASTALRARSVDLVLAAQCFHWFDTAPTLRELARVLQPDGWCAVFWNLRAQSPVMDDYDGLIRTFSSEYDVLVQQEAAPSALRAAAGVVACRETELPNAQTLDREGLFGRAYSSSCVTHGVTDRAGFERGLSALFERHQSGGRVELRYRTVCLCFQIQA